MSKQLTENQIVVILKEVEAGRRVPELCRTYSIGTIKHIQQHV